MVLKIIDEKRSYNIQLMDVDMDIFDKKDIDDYFDNSCVLNANSVYRFSLSPIIKNVKNIEIYFNDVLPTTNDRDDEYAYLTNLNLCEINPCKIDGGYYKPFVDIWGCVQFKIRVQSDTEEYFLYSKYISVLNGTKDLKDMAQMVFDSFPELISRNGELKSKIASDLRKISKDDLDLKLKLIKKIIQVYDINFNYFRSSSNFKTIQVPVIDRINKMRYVTNTSINYLVTHPENLKKTIIGRGIKIGKDTFLPERILMKKNDFSFDIYENHVILDFLYVLRNHLVDAKNLINYTINGESSSFIAFKKEMYLFSRQYLESQVQNIDKLLRHLLLLIRRYSNAFGFSFSQQIRKPKATNIFKSVPQYRTIFECIMAWYSGVYDFNNDKFMLYCIGSSRLYESFVLVSLMKGLENIGYKKIENSVFEYSNVGYLYKNVSFNNTFKYQKDDVILTMYYQPVIYENTVNSSNGIDLKRRESRKKNAESYYTPDYIIKYQRGFEELYILCDAKYSSFETVKRYKFTDILNKYMYGIQPLFGDRQKIKIGIVYGKAKGDETRKLRMTQDIISGSSIIKQEIVAAAIPLSYELLQNNPSEFINGINIILEGM